MESNGPLFAPRHSDESITGNLVGGAFIRSQHESRRSEVPPCPIQAILSSVACPAALTGPRVESTKLQLLVPDA